MRGKFDTSEQQKVNASMTVPASKETVVRKRTTATVVSPRQNKKTILKDTPVLCSQDSQITPFSKMLGLDSISNENNRCSHSDKFFNDIFENLWFPIDTDCVDLNFSSFRGFFKTMLNSWFSNNKAYINKDLLSFLSSSSQGFNVRFTDSDQTILRTRKIRVYPNKEQKHILNKWFGCARFVYNQTVDYLKQPNTKSLWMSVKKPIIDALPEWSKEVPYQIKSVAIRDCCYAVSDAKIKCKNTGKFHKVRYRSKKRHDFSLFIPKSAVTDKGVYFKKLGYLFSSEPLWRPDYDCRFLLENGRYFLCIPKSVLVKKPENQRFSICSLDPGVRTFQTLYSKEFCYKIGEHIFSRIFRYCYTLDTLLSMRRKEKSNKFDKSMQKIRWKIRDLITEIHHKTALFLCKTFDVIYLPKFEVSQMVVKLRHKVSRALLGWSHYRFKRHLFSKAEEYSCRIFECDESYTSKTCSYCGNENKVFCKEYWTCVYCGVKHDRDINGARNIFLKNVFLALRDSSTMKYSELRVADGDICE